jgi:hypothetical protein
MIRKRYAALTGKPPHRVVFMFYRQFIKKTVSLAGRLSNGVYTIKLIAAKKAYDVKMAVIQ